MNEAVLDASAVLALLRGEPGADRVAAYLARACLSAVNLAEAIERMVDVGKPLDEVASQIDRLRLTIMAFDAEQARIATSLRPATRPFGLSLADRACLAAGLTLGVPVVTADRAWQRCEVGVEVIAIR